MDERTIYTEALERFEIEAESIIARISNRDSSVFSVAIDIDENGDCTPPVKFNDYVKNEMSRLLPQQVNLAEVVTQCEVMVSETLAKQAVSTMPKNGKENARQLAKAENHLSKAAEALAEVDGDQLEQTFVGIKSLLRDARVDGNSIIEPASIALLLLAIKHSAIMIREGMPVGKHRKTDNTWFVKQICNLWQLHVGQPKPNNEKLQLFTGLLLEQIGYPIAETREILKKVLG